MRSCHAIFHFFDGNCPRYRGEHGTRGSFRRSKPSELFLCNSMHLLKTKRSQKSMTPHWPGSSRVEKLCRVLAPLIVFRLILCGFFKKVGPCMKVRWVAIVGCGVLRFCFSERLSLKKIVLTLCLQLGRPFTHYKTFIWHGSWASVSAHNLVHIPAVLTMSRKSAGLKHRSQVRSQVRSGCRSGHRWGQ